MALHLRAPSEMQHKSRLEQTDLLQNPIRVEAERSKIEAGRRRNITTDGGCAENRVEFEKKYLARIFCGADIKGRFSID